MDKALVVEGFQDLDHSESIAINGGGWGFWKVVGMVVAGWCKLFAAGAVIAEYAMGDYEGAFETYYYYWGEDEYAQ